MGKKCCCAASLTFQTSVFVEFGGTYGTGADPTSAYDCDKPTYTVFPADGEDIPIDVQVITITFSEPMQVGSLVFSRGRGIE